MQSSKMNKSKYPTKKEIINALHGDEDIADFEKYILIIECHKKSKNIGIFKGELLLNDEVILRGKMTVFPETLPNTFDWNKLNVGESFFNGFCLDYKGETLFEILKEGIDNSLREGKIPFIHR